MTRNRLWVLVGGGLVGALTLAVLLPGSRAGYASPASTAMADFAGRGLEGVGASFNSGVFGDDHVFISDSSTLRVSDAATLAPVTDVSGSLGTSGGFDDGRHMVVDGLSERIFVSDHDNQFDVFDFSLTEFFPTWGVSLSEPLGIAPLPDGKLLITDEEDSDGLFRLNSDLSFDTQASGSFSFDGAEGVVYDSVHDRVFVADEDDEEIEIFDGMTLDHIGTVDFPCSFGDGPYWLGVDGSSDRVFVLADGRCPVFPEVFTEQVSNYGIHVFDIISGGDDLSFNQTLFGSGGGSVDCYGTLAVSESTDRLFAIDYCSDTVDVYDAATLGFVGTVPLARAGGEPLMVSVGRFDVLNFDCLFEDTILGNGSALGLAGSDWMFMGPDGFEGTGTGASRFGRIVILIGGVGPVAAYGAGFCPSGLGKFVGVSLFPPRIVPLLDTIP